NQEQGSITASVTPPQCVKSRIAGLPRLLDARQAAADARTNGLGVYSSVDGQGPLRLLPYELRFLAGRRTPARRVLNLDPAIAGTPQEHELLRPEQYFTIPKLEDRLFVDDHFVPLFQR